MIAFIVHPCHLLRAIVLHKKSRHLSQGGGEEIVQRLELRVEGLDWDCQVDNEQIRFLFHKLFLRVPNRHLKDLMEDFVFFGFEFLCEVVVVICLLNP